MGENTFYRVDRDSIPHRKIVITRHRQKNIIRIKMLEHIDDLRMHGIEIVFEKDGTIHVSGFGYGFASPINMFQSSGSWYWGSLSLDRNLNIDRDIECDDLVYLVQDIVNSLRDPIIDRFIREFIRGYYMHGKKICAKIYFELE